MLATLADLLAPVSLSEFLEGFHCGFSITIHRLCARDMPSSHRIADATQLTPRSANFCGLAFSP
jgi:hypothetical protein